MKLSTQGVDISALQDKTGASEKKLNSIVLEQRF